MSKQTNDQDEQKSPSGKGQDGKGQGGKGREATVTPKPTNDTGKGPQHSTPASQPSTSPKAGEKTPAAPAAATPAANTSASAADDKGSASPDKQAPSGTPAPGSPKPGQPQAGGDKPSGAKPEPAKSGGGGSATAGSPAATDKPSTDKPAIDKPSTDKPAADKPAADKSANASGSTRAAPAGGGAAVPPAAGDGGKGGGRAAGVLALILVLFLGIGAGLFAWNAWERLDEQQQRLADLEERAGGAASADDVAQLREELEQGEEQRDAEMAEAIEAMRGEFSSYRSEVDDALDQVLAELSREQDADEREWLHAEAAYLLRLANQRLQLERDVEGAAALLRTADARLNEADNPALLSVRRAIASELSILDGVPQVDRTGLYLALDAQQQRLAQLPLSRELEEIPARSGMQEAPAGGWQDQLSRFGQELRDLVVIRHHDEAFETLVTPEQESYLRQSARLVLEQAQLALLKEEQELYEASLDKALALIEGYYDTERSEVQAVIEQLQELQGENIQPELPDISGSQQALAEFIERRFGSRSDRGDDA
ncbi:MAG: uroporphyrinogen-III C-methyltransferase [Halomonas sp.]|nr:uroporphyrinogen-III C-methyltransferase [Halomonas sp.]MCC5881863.1 uroporphyrinogen-III C-methyltransferase [Halomonas sp.]